jgi:hypothetical protein
MNTIEQIAKAPTYSVAVDRVKNRLYITGYGNVIRAIESEPFVDAVKEAIKLLNPGFTCLADFREVELFTMDDMTATVQKAMITSGMSRVAAVWGPQLLARRTVRRAVEQVHASEQAHQKLRREFDNNTDAEAWLVEALKPEAD